VRTRRRNRAGKHYELGDALPEGVLRRIHGENADRMTRLKTVALMSALLAVGLYAEPIKVHPVNPHYYLFNGKPTILITSAEHYGGVVNKDFDYVTYLDALKSYGLNYTRIYAGAMFEPQGKFIKGNPL